MRIVCLHDKNEIEVLLRQNTFLHLYSIGDLDDFFWQHTTWYGLQENTLKQVVLLYTGSSLPVLLGLTAEPILMAHLLRSIIHLLPRQFYAHLSGDLAQVFAGDYQIQSHGLHHKMALTNSQLLADFDTSEVVQLTVENADEIEDLYRLSYPENWFDSRMLETGYYYGIRRGNNLVSIAGVHVYSPQYKVTALGNITTHPQFRGQGLSKSVTARLCQELLKTVSYVGLNVKADNAIAIACYEKLGFKRIGTYEEYLLNL
ncbi:GNAT family N-acetyltransferase [Gloeocapsopsis dulcis]|uniref:GNAT family N-acetyltransferase n=1 Tax=Gloeocapsopsis dulcis AAB1 = 1H9 TaxID=1433147 RepID=A0A6N8FW91_9CHRO|nr:GNAT family N-acetyltransferase [Gloeocapsopsis dulcis]MUL37211.1 GNAT family N-acetyltransferase [Gloeocapsopsis dulcis AAB1 = 1H9]WNN90178.1 GNAT family N-acetyltransferase [Gloeocapsopsis dulcis]